MEKQSKQTSSLIISQLEITSKPKGFLLFSVLASTSIDRAESGVGCCREKEVCLIVVFIACYCVVLCGNLLGVVQGVFSAVDPYLDER